MHFRTIYWYHQVVKKEKLLNESAFLGPLVPPGFYEGEAFVCEYILVPLVSPGCYEGLLCVIAYFRTTTIHYV